jgi:serine/threonine protein kinase
LESHGFIHADLSEGNLILQGNAPSKGDMALVDFDAYACPRENIKHSAMKGTHGYAAPEVSNQESLSIGSDRTAMGLLIQEILLAGHPSVPALEWTTNPYDQESDINARQGRARESFRDEFTELAKLLDATLAASTPAERPEPERWLARIRDHHDLLLSEMHALPRPDSRLAPGRILRGPHTLKARESTSPQPMTVVEPRFGHRVNLEPGASISCVVWFDSFGIHVQTTHGRRIRLRNGRAWVEIGAVETGPLGSPLEIFDSRAVRRANVTLEPTGP